MDKITDIHMHVIPDYDDGAKTFSTSIEMLKMAYRQGVRNVFCTSHNVYEVEKAEKYKEKFKALQMFSGTMFPSLNLHMGCELLCAGEYMDDILYGLEIGVFLPLGNSNCVLTELYPDATAEEAKLIVATLIEGGYKPVLAHYERYELLGTEAIIKELTEMGALIQVNLQSLTEKCREQELAGMLVEKKYAHFIGSDAHSSSYRAPEYKKGIEHLKSICDEKYFQSLINGNAETFLL